MKSVLAATLSLLSSSLSPSLGISSTLLPLDRAVSLPLHSLAVGDVYLGRFPLFYRTSGRFLPVPAPLDELARTKRERKRGRRG